MAIFNGTDLILKVQAVNGAADEYKLMHCTTCSLSISSDTIDVSNKDSAGWKDLLGGQKSFSLSGDGFMDFASTGSTTDPDELVQNLFDRDSVTFTFALATPAGYKFTGSGFITSVEISGGTEDAPTYSISIDGTGALAKSPV